MRTDWAQFRDRLKLKIKLRESLMASEEFLMPLRHHSSEITELTGSILIVFKGHLKDCPHVKFLACKHLKTII